MLSGDAVSDYIAVGAGLQYGHDIRVVVVKRSAPARFYLRMVGARTQRVTSIPVAFGIWISSTATSGLCRVMRLRATSPSSASAMTVMSSACSKIGECRRVPRRGRFGQQHNGWAGWFCCGECPVSQLSPLSPLLPPVGTSVQSGQRPVKCGAGADSEPDDPDDQIAARRADASSVE